MSRPGEELDQPAAGSVRSRLSFFGLGKMTFRPNELALDFPEMNLSTVPIEVGDPVNARILSVAEDRIQGFQRDPLGAIARQSGVDLPVVMERIQAMLRAGTIRRVRQTLLATNL